jgi:hypothetical protein
METSKKTYLVGGLEHVLFFHSVGNVIIPTDFHSIIFQRGFCQPPDIIIQDLGVFFSG